MKRRHGGACWKCLAQDFIEPLIVVFMMQIFDLPF